MGITDEFNAKVLLSILLTMMVLSVLLTIIGPMVGTKEISSASFKNFFQAWPRNFGIAFWIELLIAHPIARFAMKSLHARQDRKVESVNM